MTEHDITAIVLTLNEEAHLPGCLDSLRLLTPALVVLDSGSTDRTVEIARAAGARVVTRQFDGYASQRNAGLDIEGGSDWTLFLDADERLTPAGVAEIRERIAGAGDDVAAFWLPRRNMFFGRQVTGGGWWPDHQARLFRRGRARYDESRQVHEVALIDGASEHLLEPLIHINYDTRREFARKQREFTLRRARQSTSGARPRRRAYLSAPAREFHRRFIAGAGYRDGATGLFLATVLALEEVRACRLLRSQDT
ncbi:MAG TPA: glycosyltransferase family 2 protein [Thermomicrobiales bacterium]|nr:glycosyltransferase family 2 protein [Thermomicrobiales bacterium]